MSACWTASRASHSATFDKRLVISCLGSTYKPESDDLWESAAIEIARDLARTAEEQVVIADPNLSALAEPLTALWVDIVKVRRPVGDVERHWNCYHEPISEFLP